MLLAASCVVDVRHMRSCAENTVHILRIIAELRRRQLCLVRVSYLIIFLRSLSCHHGIGLKSRPLERTHVSIVMRGARNNFRPVGNGRKFLRRPIVAQVPTLSTGGLQIKEHRVHVARALKVRLNFMHGQSLELLVGSAAHS